MIKKTIDLLEQIFISLIEYDDLKKSKTSTRHC